MKKLSLISFLTIIVAVMSLSAIAAHEGHIVKLRDDVKSFEVVQLLTRKGDEVKNLGITRGNYLKVSFKDQESERQIARLSKHPAVEFVSPNYVYTIVGHKGRDNDPKFRKQWGLYNKRRKGVDVNAVKAWEINKGSKAVIVAVIDTGVDYNHKDLKQNIWVNREELEGEPGIDDDNNGYVDDIHGYDFANNDNDPMDDHGHGTHCAGVIGAVHDNGIGIKGVMAHVRILALKFLGRSGQGTTAGAIKAIDYAINAGVKIMSNSWGGGPSEFDLALESLIREAEKEGIVFVAAAGNWSWDNDIKKVYPASYEIDNVISVGSMTRWGKKSSFSNYGANSVHIFAPGSRIYSTVKKGRYKRMSGTSMAAPHVSGVVGLLLSQMPGSTPLEVRERVIATARRSGKMEKLCVAGGWIDAEKLLSN